jgi:predicted HAD superfamily Cof-like phosphohydrolase
MRKQLESVRKFHNAYGLGVNEHPVALVSKEQSMLRYNLMQEENEEYLEAALKNDLEEVADALGDMLYILCGTILDHGLQYKIEAIFDEIQRSNMSKLGSDGNPILREDGKVMKGPNYFSPDLKRVLNDIK